MAALAIALTLAGGQFIAASSDLSVSAKRDADGTSASVSWTAYDGADFEYYRVIVCDDSQYDGASCNGTVFISDPFYDAAYTGPVAVTGLDPDTGYGVILQIWQARISHQAPRNPARARTHPHSRADSHRDARTDSDAYPYARTHSNPHAYPYGDPRANRDSDSNARTHADAHAHAYPYSYPHARTDRDAYPNSDSNAHPYANTHARADAYPHAHARNRARAAGRRRRHSQHHRLRYRRQ